jgi:pyruvate ferredoxin oxidoreductase gamma subunit
MPNTPMIGALAKVTGLFTVDQIVGHLTKTFGKKFAQDVIDANIASVTRAFEEVQVA